MVYISATIISGITASIFPFMDWFNQRRYKVCLRCLPIRFGSSLYSEMAHRVLLMSIFRRHRTVDTHNLSSLFHGHDPLRLYVGRANQNQPYSSFFAVPITPSLLSYIVGLCFYATHFPECAVHRTEDGHHWTDWLGGGSHAIWHLFIIAAILLHRIAIPELMPGVAGEGHCRVWGAVGS